MSSASMALHISNIRSRRSCRSRRTCLKSQPALSSVCSKCLVLELANRCLLWIAASSSIYGENRMMDPTVLLTYSLIVLGFVLSPAPRRY